jgi:hypothetical protein
MDVDLVRRIIRDGLLLLLMAGLIMIMVHYGTQQVQEAQQQNASPEQRSASFRNELALRGLALGPSAKMDEWVHTPQENGEEHWGIITLNQEDAFAFRSRIGQLDHSLVSRKVIEDNDLGLEQLNLPIGKAPKWWYDPRKIGASVVTIVDDNTQRADVLYMGVSYVTGQIYLCHWTGGSSLWKDRPPLQRRSPATVPATLPADLNHAPI